jgi:hypothetical protein
MLIFTEEATTSLRDGEFPDVAHGDPLDARNIFGGDSKSVALRTAANKGTLDSAARRGLLGDGGFAGCKVQAAAGEGAGAEEAAAVHEAGQRRCG